MNRKIQSANHFPASLRLAAGGLLVLLGVAGFAWMATIFFVDYHYREIPPLIPGQTGRQALTEYAYKLKQLLKLDPTNGDMRNLYASVLGKIGQYQDAVDNLEIARKTSNNQDSLYFLADMYEKLGDIKQAEAAMAECLIINPIDKLFNPARLRLLNSRLLNLMALKKRDDKAVDEKVLQQARQEFAEAAINWAIRAPNDVNSYLFLGQFYINNKPLYALEAYRCYLIAFSKAAWLDMNNQFMLVPQQVLVTINQILDGHFAKPYRNLP